MFKAKLRTSLLDIENILRRVHEVEIYKWLLGETIYLNTKILNTIRGEKNPSLEIWKGKDNKFRHKDWAKDEWSGDVFHLVQMKYNCSFSEALSLIDEHFNLGLGDNSPIEERVFRDFTPPEGGKKIIHPNKIRFKYRKRWSKEAISFWEKIYPEAQKDKTLFEIVQFWIDDKIYPFQGVGFAYWEKIIDKTKIYLPQNRDKTGRRRKFYSDMPFDYLYKDHIGDYSLPIILTKSRKDELLLSRYSENVTSIQAENISCLTQENIEFLRRFPMVYVNMGSDTQGKEESIKITRTFGWKHLNTPDKFLEEDLNDFSSVENEYESFTKSYLAPRGLVNKKTI